MNIAVNPNVQIPEGFKEDAHGNYIRIDKIKDIDLLRDELVHKAVNKFLEGVTYLTELKKTMLLMLDEFLELSASDHGKNYKGKRGGFSLTTFDGKHKIKVCISDHHDCDERIQIGRSLIKDCMDRWASEGINQNLATIIADKYKLNTKGEVNVREILSLRKYQIKDADWIKAMEVITDSIFAAGSKSYLRFYERDKNNRYVQIRADFSAI